MTNSSGKNISILKLWSLTEVLARQLAHNTHPANFIAEMQHLAFHNLSLHLRARHLPVLLRRLRELLSAVLGKYLSRQFLVLLTHRDSVLAWASNAWGEC